jgi:hypothetical protein
VTASRQHVLVYWVGIGLTGLFATFYSVPFLLSAIFGWRPEGTDPFYVFGVIVPLALWVLAVVLGGLARTRRALIVATVPLVGVAVLAVGNMLALAGVIPV